MSVRLGVSLSFLMLVAGCSFDYELQAVERSGRIAFEPKDDQGTGCLWDFTVTSETGEVVWRLDGGTYQPPPCDNKLPILYGVVPAGMKELVHALPLRAGVLYRIEGLDGDHYHGAFRFKQAIIVENLGEQR